MKRRRISRQRLAYERRVLDRFRAAGASSNELRRCRWLLTIGRKDGTSLSDAARSDRSERACIDIMVACIRGELPDGIVSRAFCDFSSKEEMTYAG